MSCHYWGRKARVQSILKGKTPTLEIIRNQESGKEREKYKNVMSTFSYTAKFSAPIIFHFHLRQSEFSSILNHVMA